LELVILSDCVDEPKAEFLAGEVFEVNQKIPLNLSPQDSIKPN
jgi:hypothetical protein